MKWLRASIIALAVVGAFLFGAYVQDLSTRVRTAQENEMVSLKLPKTHKELNRRVLLNAMDRVMLDELGRLEKGGRFPLER